jgi:peptidoglycan hydrolase-like protein with peptidoglycan-binding domain
MPEHSQTPRFGSPVGLFARATALLQSRDVPVGRLPGRARAPISAADFSAGARLLRGIVQDLGEGAVAGYVGADVGCASGPPRREVDEDDPSSGLPPLVYAAPSGLESKRRSRPSVGFAQQLLNKFLKQVALFGAARVCGAARAAAVQALIASMKQPELSVDCDFGRETDRATRAFQQGFGLTVDGKIGPQTWPVLLSRSDFIQLQVRDVFGRTLGGRRFVLSPTNPALPSRRGRLDGNGVVRLLTIAPADYDLVLPDSPNTRLVVTALA